MKSVVKNSTVWFKVFLILPLLLVMLSSACSTSKEVDESSMKVTGEVTVVGNEPFTKPAIRSGNDVYILQVEDKDMKSTLMKAQGNLYEIYFIEQKESPDGKVLVVKDIKPASVNNSQK